MTQGRYFGVRVAVAVAAASSADIPHALSLPYILVSESMNDKTEG